MLKEFNIKNLKDNPFKLIGEEWMLITAGDNNKCNTMTASWGSLGVLWNKNVATVFVRPTRYTFEFMEKEDFFTLSFLGENKTAHKICGNKSGRDMDKISASSLTPIYDGKSVYFEEAELVIVCKKIYTSRLDNANFLDKDTEKLYKLKDYHHIYVGEIIKALKKDNR